ncbi:hypothetical protein [Pseudacidovorax sp. NFM-22]|uniref:hypothetical protein n=1 Tax=Pseudacidovorax sp. NFM-22 TaxID=2744469 RepID=UPI001F3E5E09|nr:hypothetical protein [Pseudacidovorax sp. NFM-22]
MPRSAHLIDAPSGTPADIQRHAEGRFLRELERLLGDDLAPALRAFEAAQASSAEDLSKDEIRLASRWGNAYDKARQAGMRDLGAIGEAYFAVRLDT